MIKRIKSEYAETTQVPLYNSLNIKHRNLMIGIKFEKFSPTI